MRVISIVSQVQVIGYIWMPRVLCAMTYRLSPYDIESIKDRSECDGKITRCGVESWLDVNSGDFSEVIDFSVTIGDGEFDSDWSSEENEVTFYDCMYGSEN